MMGVAKLINEKNERFCQEYLVDLNATQAYIRAGYKPKAADVSGSRLLANARVRARIDELLAKRSLRVGVNQDRVVQELARIAFLDPTKLASLDAGTVLEDATEDDRAAIAGVKVKTGSDWTEREIRFADKLKALEMLGRHLGMFQDNVNVQGPMPQIVIDFPRQAQNEHDAG